MRLGLHMAEVVEGDARAELRRAEEARNAMEQRLRVKLVALWSDDRLWRRGPGLTQVLDRTTPEARRRLQRTQQRARDMIDYEYARLERALLPPLARAP